METKRNNIEPLINYLWAADKGIDELKRTLRSKINIVFESVKEFYPRIFNDNIVLDKNKLFYAMSLLQNIHISDDCSRNVIRNGYEMQVQSVQNNNYNPFLELTK